MKFAFLNVMDLRLTGLKRKNNLSIISRLKNQT